MKTMIDYQFLAGDTDEISIKAANGGYYFSGGGEEAAEILDKMRGIDENSTKDDCKGFVLELGDRMWYAVRNIYSLSGSTPLQGMLSIDGLDEQCTTARAAVKLSVNALRIVTNDIVILTGKINGYHKRMLRDNNGNWTAARVKEVCDAEKLVIEKIVEASHCAGYTFREVLEFNIAKLASRKCRGTLHGSGDFR